MGSLYKKNVIETALKEVGYQADGKWNKYADELDAVDYFTGCGKKQGRDWCCVFVCWCIYKNTEPDPDVWDAHYFLYQSDSCDMAAVVKYAADYFKQNNAFDTDSKYACTGDQIFFRNESGLSHTGLVVDWDDRGIYTVEGNTNGGKVAKKFYSYGDSKIAGFGHPRYDSAASDPKPDQEVNITVKVKAPDGVKVNINVEKE